MNVLSLPVQVGAATGADGESRGRACAKGVERHKSLGVNPGTSLSVNTGPLLNARSVMK